MPPKGSKKVPAKKVIKLESPVPESDIDEKAEESGEIGDDDVEEEAFFNQDSYNEYIHKMKLDVFNPSNYASTVHREEIIIPDEFRKTPDIMTRYEYARVISERAKQIENGSTIFAHIGDEIDPMRIAELEICQKTCPLMVRRHVNPFMVEVWAVNDLTVPFR